MIVCNRWAMVMIVTSELIRWRKIACMMESVLQSKINKLAKHQRENNHQTPIAEVAWKEVKTRVNSWQPVQQYNSSPSSKIRSLLPRTIARAKVRSCRWPTDKLPPPLAMLLSNVGRASSSSSWSENSPAARNASFKVASSCCSNGSKLRRSVPIPNDKLEWRKENCLSMNTHHLKVRA